MHPRFESSSAKRAFTADAAAADAARFASLIAHWMASNVDVVVNSAVEGGKDALVAVLLLVLAVVQSDPEVLALQMLLSEVVCIRLRLRISVISRFASDIVANDKSLPLL